MSEQSARLSGVYVWSKKFFVLASAIAAFPASADASTYVGNPNRNLEGVSFQAPGIMYSAIVTSCSATVSVPNINGGPSMEQTLSGGATSCLVLTPAYVPMSLYGVVDSNGAAITVDLWPPVYVFDAGDFAGLPADTAFIIEMGGGDDFTGADLSPDGQPAYIQPGGATYELVHGAFVDTARAYVDVDGDGELSAAERAAGAVSTAM